MKLNYRNIKIHGGVQREVIHKTIVPSFSNEEVMVCWE